MWKLYWTDDDDVLTVTAGKSRRDWNKATWCGIQLLAVKLDPKSHGKSRVAWYRDNPGLWGEYGFYQWGSDGHPEGVTPDAVLDRWRAKTGETNVTLADLSLDDFRSIGVKIGRSIPTPQFEQILRLAIEDPEIQ